MDVIKYRETHRGENHGQVICDWLAAARVPSYQVTEAHENARLWRGRLTEPVIDAFILFYLRALRADGDSGRFQPNVLSRRGTILFHDGWVNGKWRTFEELR